MRSFKYSDIRSAIMLRYGTGAEFGRALGVKKSYANNLINGNRPPSSTEQIRKIAKLLYIDPVILAILFTEQRMKVLYRRKDG